MKQSVIVRSILVVLLFAGWFYSLFPTKDKDFFQTVSDLAQPQLSTYEKAGDKAKAEAFGKMMVQAKKLVADAQAGTGGQQRRSLAPYAAVEEAAKGTLEYPRLHLRDYISISGQSKATNKLILNYVRRQAAGKFRWGLDIRGGTEFVIGFSKDDVPNGSSVDEIRKEILEILERRVNGLGVAEPEIKEIGPTSISVRMPTVTENDKAGIRSIIQNAGKLEFHIVDQEQTREYQANPQGFKCTTGFRMVETEPEGDSEQGEFLVIKKMAERVRGKDVDKAWAASGQVSGYEVLLKFNSEGAVAFADVTRESVGKRMAIMLDNKVYSAPNINEPITGGSAVISGSFTAEEVQNLASILNGGRMRVQPRIDSEFGTDPTLGNDSIHAGVLAAIVGAIAVIIFMLIYYHLSGVIAVIAMVANIFFQIGTMTLLGATFTLPGIAGIVLTIGMAVDANILIYERFREEQAAGKSLANTIQAGFGRAFWTIFDSHVTALIAGVILYWFGTGPVKGFAVTLCIGLIANMFTSIIVSRIMFDGLLLTNLKKLTMFHIFRQVPHFDFMGVRRWFFVFSGVLTAVAIGFIGYRFYTGEALSTDFTGGTTITYSSGEKMKLPEVGDIRQAAFAAQIGNDLRIGYKKAGLTDEKLLEVTIPKALGQKMVDRDAAVQTALAAIAGGKRTAAREKAIDTAMETLSARVTTMLKEKFMAAKFEPKQTYTVGGLVGDQFKKNAIYALLFSWIAIIIYLAFRFEFAYGVAAVVALIHDVIVAAGVGAVCDVQMSLIVLAALLTIIGFSVNDTIVVFDRIRESFSLQRKGNYAEVVNLSINQTLSRTLLTSLTVFICVFFLYLLGGGAIHDFALIMLAGVVIGTYSSIFVASAIIVSWHKRSPLHLAPAVKKVDPDEEV